LFSLIGSLVKPYRGSLAVVLVAMVLQMAATVAAPWPLKVVLDNVVGEHKLPHWLSDLLEPCFPHGTKMEIAAAAAIALVVIALIGAIASGIANYYNASVGQYSANDLRLRTYDHLQQLSLNYYSEHDLGTLLSTLTADLQTIPSFASGSTLDIMVDLLTILSMLAPFASRTARHTGDQMHASLTFFARHVKFRRCRQYRSSRNRCDRLDLFLYGGTK
jgi:ABC-type multidrug transport system fused ATPase/permease subunit